jgi:hypothetical protein
LPNFDRFANVTIGQRGERGFLFEGFRVIFSITKSNEPTPNSGTVSIFNLAEFSRNKIRNIGDAIQLEAGYREDEYGGRLVITADVLDIVTEQAGADIVTVVRLGDGIEFLKTVKDAYSFKEGTSVKEILRKIASAAGITLKSLDGVDDAAYANGFSEMGPLGDILDKLVGRLGAQWSFQNNELQITPKLGHNGSPVFRLSSETGMVGIPTRDVDTSVSTPQPQSDGWKVISLLRPELGPGDRVEIVSEIADASGIYHIQDVTHSGDTHQGDWTSTLRVRESRNA